MSGITFFTEILKAKTNEKDISSCIIEENSNNVNDNINISKKSKYCHYFCLNNDVLDDTDADSSDEDDDGTSSEDDTDSDTDADSSDEEDDGTSGEDDEDGTSSEDDDEL